MKKNKTAYAHAFAVTTAFVWTVCTFGIALLPDFSLTISKWWMHGLTMTRIGTWNVTVNGFIYGGLILVGFAWITGYVFGATLEYCSKK